MRESNQSTQLNQTPIKQTKTTYNFPPNYNVIKITQMGFEALSNIHQWSVNKNQTSKSFAGMRIRLQVPTEPVQLGLGNKFCKSKTFYGRKRVQSSRKARRIYQKWTKSQQSISANIQKQMNKRSNQKTKQCEWPKISYQIKDGISNILSQWKNSIADQKDRVRYRLKHIYDRKYIKQRRTDCKQNVKKLSKKPSHLMLKLKSQFQ